MSPDALPADARTPTPRRRVAIVGPGAVGLGLATALHASDVEIHLLARPGSEASAALAGGFGRSGIFGEVQVPAEAVQLHDNLDSLIEIDPDATLVCTKTTATASLSTPLGSALGRTPRESPLVICHNGWGSAEQFAAHLVPQRVFSARVITGFRRPEPARVEITVHAEPIHVGSLFGADVGPLAWLCEAVDAGGLPCATSPDIAADLLAKLLYNGLLNPLGALVGVPYGVLAERRDTRTTMEAIAREIFTVLDAAGLRTHWPNAGAYLETFFGDLLPSTAAHESSMLQDLRAGRRTEVDAISGAVVALGRHHDVSTPLNEALTTLIAAVEARHEGAGANGAAPTRP